MLHLQVDIESTEIQYRPVNAMLLMKGGGYWEYWNPIPPCKCNVANEYSSSYGIIYDHLLLLANNLLGNNAILQTVKDTLCKHFKKGSAMFSW